jgi:hypothetical protein
MICDDCKCRVFDIWIHNDKMTCWKCMPQKAKTKFSMIDTDIFCSETQAIINVENLIVIIKEF